MAGQKFTLTFDAQLNVSQMRGALNQIQSTLNGLKLPDNMTRGITNTMSHLEKELRNFEIAAGKDLTSKTNFGAFERSAEKISALFKDLQIQAKNLGANVDVNKLFPAEVVSNIQKATEAIKEYERASKKAATAIASEKTNQVKREAKAVVAKEDYDKAKAAAETFAKEYENIMTQLFSRVSMKSKDIFNQDNAKEALTRAAEMIQKADRVQRGVDVNGNKHNYTEEQKKSAEELSATLTELIQKFGQLTSASENQGLAEKVEKAKKAWEDATAEVDKYKRIIEQMEAVQKTNDQTAISKLLEDLKKIDGLDLSKFKGDVTSAKQILEEYVQTAQGDAKQAAETLIQSLNGLGDATRRNSEDVRRDTDNWRQFDAQVRDVSALKSRIQYFFGINNAINLFRRAIRGALTTVKELDKAMTETAVVTNYTIKDMWAQLPEYTKRANELGVTTKDAYEAATLYFQQGLNADQAAALSTETLKMARIAGLEAAEATDRMTNALRGFNMELDALNAQRVDDVYSQLAAMSASNVDEISTAMTKVASLAHNANMEFETTAAFLAQIIETTRESAETAGTALKTVIARFSEVKKLYSEDQLKGTDEEGQGIDVNKISTALRTAGIDLNKYFLGEVGLDDIFMELASKWDTLTSVQQRYIATQAAGSRQQSRFIALMQDYKRTTELVTAAQNANGASAKQFAKTQESLQSKLARLKNAWNEFLMGLANNAVIKGAVDALTTLLNIINKLTSAFGDGVGSFLKWTAVAASFFALKGAFSTGGIIDTGLMGLIGGGKLGNALVRGGILSGLVGRRGAGGVAKGLTGDAATIAAGNAAGGASKSGLPLIIGGIGNLGKKAWFHAQDIGNTLWGAGGAQVSSNVATGISTGGIAGLQAGLAGIGTAVAAIGAALLTAYGVYKLWENSTPEGQLKKAKKEAEKLKQESEELNNQLKTYNSLQDSYKEKTAAVEKATTAEDRKKAIEDRNKAIQDALKEDQTLAQYVVVERIDDEIVLTINEDAFSKAIEGIEKALSQKIVETNFADATVAKQQAKIYGNNLKEYYATTRNENDLYKANPHLYDNISVEDMYQEIMDSSQPGAFKLNAAEVYAQYAGAMGQARANVEMAYAEMMKGLKLDDTLVNALLPVLSKAWEETGQQLTIDQIGTITSQENLSPILQAINGQGKMTEVNLQNVNLEDENALYDALGLSEEALENFADALGMSKESILKQIKASAKQQKAIQQANTKKIFSTALQTQTLDENAYQKIKSSTPAELQQLSDIIENAEKALDKSGLAELMNSIFNGMSTSQLKEIQDFYNNFNLDTPIKAFHELKQAQDAVADRPDDDPFKNMLDNIREVNAAIFNSGNLLQEFLTSSSYDGLTESLEKFIETNGRITSNNIDELADSCKDLQYLIDDAVVSTQGLAEAFTQLQEGSLVFDDITSSLLAALGAGENFNSLMDKVSAWIKDFNKGTDLTEGTEHIISTAKEGLEMANKWQFGNEPLENIYDHFFGKGAYETYMKEAYKDTKVNFEAIAAKLSGDLQRISDLSENEGLGALQELATQGALGIKQLDEAGLEFEWDLSQFDSTTDAINAVSKALGVGTDAARAFIEAWGSHMWDLRQQWNDLNFHDSITAFVEDLGEAKVVTEQELQSIAEASGKTRDEVLAEIQQIRNEIGPNGIVIPVNWKNDKGAALHGKDLIDQFNDVSNSTTRAYVGSSLEKTGVDYSKFADDFNLEFKKNVTLPTGIELQDTINGLDFSRLHQHIMEAYKVDSSQADEIVEEIGKKTGKMLTAQVEIPVTADDGTLTTMTETIEADSAEALRAGIEVAQETAKAQLLAEKLAKSDYSTLAETLTNMITSAGETGGAAAAQAIATACTDIPGNVLLTWSWANGPPPTHIGGNARGGIVDSYAKGSEKFHTSPGTALTGEEGAEIVWNKNKGYAYLTGKDGPEFQNLQPGDRIFNAAETQKILRKPHSKNDMFDSYASGGWNPEVVNGGGGRGGSGGGSGKEGNPTEWENELDWLYNLMEDIAELQRVQTKLAEKHDRYLEDISKTGRDLYNVTRQQLNNLYTERDNQREALIRRRQEMDEQIGITGLGNYVWWNDKDSTIEIDWDAIEAIQDKDTYDKVKELIDKVEKIQDEMDTAQDALWDIEGKIKELEDRYLQEFTDFQQRIMDAVVNMYQESIDNLTSLNDTLNDTNSKILDSLQKEIDYSRQIRDNTETERNIADMEARLAYLRRDTTGGNAQEIRELEKQLEDARQNYEDTLIDQSLQRLQESNEQATEQRQQQIDLLTAQLEYWQETGALWDEVAQLMQDGISTDGTLVRGSQLEQVLANAEGWKGMSEAQREVWANDLILATNQAAAYLIKISEGIGGISAGIWAMIPSSSVTSQKLQYATGGLNNKTGWAWLDGTASEPEYVLNARQTDAFLKLADVLPSMMGNGGITNNMGGNVYVELSMNVGSISSDYDVDRMVERIKEDIYDASSYRNPTAISYIR